MINESKIEDNEKENEKITTTKEVKEALIELYQKKSKARLVTLTSLMVMSFIQLLSILFLVGEDKLVSMLFQMCIVVYAAFQIDRDDEEKRRLKVLEEYVEVVEEGEV